LAARSLQSSNLARCGKRALPSEALVKPRVQGGVEPPHSKTSRISLGFFQPHENPGFARLTAVTL